MMALPLSYRNQTISHSCLKQLQLLPCRVRSRAFTSTTASAMDRSAAVLKYPGGKTVNVIEGESRIFGRADVAQCPEALFVSR